MYCAARTWAVIALLVAAAPAGAAAERRVEIPIGASGELEVAEIVSRLAAASGIALERPADGFSLSTRGLARSLTKTLLSETLGPEVSITFGPGVMLMTVDERILAPERREEWLRRLRDLSDRARDASRRRQSYGMRALASYRPNDRRRPTLCLVHGLNSSSGGFVHMIPWLEEAGYGVVIYDYPFNRRIEESCAGLCARLGGVSRKAQELLPWSIVAHSMGALLGAVARRGRRELGARCVVARADRAGESRVAPGQGSNRGPAHKRSLGHQGQEHDEGDARPLRRARPGR